MEEAATPHLWKNVNGKGEVTSCTYLNREECPCDYIIWNSIKLRKSLDGFLFYSCLTLLTLYRKTESAFSKWRGSGHVFFIKICEGCGHHSPTNKVSGGRFVYGSSWRLMKEVSIPSRLRLGLRKWRFSIKIRVGGGHFHEDKWPFPLQSEKWMVCVLMRYYT